MTAQKVAIRELVERISPDMEELPRRIAAIEASLKALAAQNEIDAAKQKRMAKRARAGKGAK